MVAELISSEYEEQIALCQYLELKHYKYFHVPNSTWTKSFNQKRRNKALGVKAGVPDMMIFVGSQLIAIELKRVKKSVTSPEQKMWIDTFNKAGIPARICKGFDECQKFIEDVELMV